MKEEFEQFTKPLSSKEIEWKIQSTTSSGKTIIVPYLDNRAVLSRLDFCFGSMGWKNEFQPVSENFFVPATTKKKEVKRQTAGYLCGISIKSEDGWVTKWDGATNTEIEPIKGGISDSMKRCANQWGMGRELYDYPKVMIKEVIKFIPDDIKKRLEKLTDQVCDSGIDSIKSNVIIL